MAFGVRIFLCILCNKCRIEGATEWHRYDKQPAEIKELIKILTSRTLCSGCREVMNDILKGGKNEK
jgi:hypothetical protein